MAKRPVDLVVISDVHLGTAACRAAELNAYLKSIRPGRLVLNGDIVDLWDFRKGFWPESHTKVVRRILKFAADGVPVHYITGNHDGALRRYSDLALGAIDLVDRLELEVGGRRHWFLHGDAFDLALGTGAALSWFGSRGYDAVVTLGIAVNAVRRILGLGQVSLAAACKRRLGAARAHIARFEECCLRAASARGYDVVVAGHIHVAADRTAVIGGRTVRYLNSGDWVDSLTALECHGGIWSVASYADLVARGLVAPPEQQDETVAVSSPAA